MRRIQVSLFLAMALSGSLLVAQATKPVANDAEQQEICSYITTHMSSVISQVPTLCSASRDDASKYQKSQYFNISVFASGNVLQGSMRRAWVSALFQTMEGVAQDTPLKKACSGDNVCHLSFADTQMTEHNWHYELYLRSGDVDSLQSMVKASNSTEFSELWYKLWWGGMDKVSSNPRSKENAKLLGEDACKSFSEVAAKRAKEYGIEFPSCSVLLATSDNIYVVIDFNDLMKASLYRRIADDLLPSTIASRLNNTGYSGDVVVRSPWLKTTGGNERVYRIYRLRDLEFADEEEMSGSRSESDVHLMLAMWYEGNGLITQDRLLSDPKSDSAVRPLAVVSMTRNADGSQIVDTTDGAAWRVSAKSSAECDLQVGNELFLFATGETVNLTKDHKGTNCKLDASFVMGW
jgi:hypothetical protein